MPSNRKIAEKVAKLLNDKEVMAKRNGDLVPAGEGWRVVYDPDEWMWVVEKDE